MREIWADAVRVLGGTADSGDLEERYREPHRSYHNTVHALAVVRDSATLAAEFDVDERAVLTLAALAHDVIYDGKPGDDERASARWARRHLPGVAEPHVARVESLVLATLTHTSDDPLAHALLDADLAILGATPAEYDRYSVAVRAEYAAYDDAAWRAGRVKVLASLLGRERLYVTNTAQELWESAARTNLTRELASLT